MEGFVKNIDESEYVPMNEMMEAIDENLNPGMEELANTLAVKTFKLLDLKDNVKHDVIFDRIRVTVLSLSVNLELLADKRIRTKHCKQEAKFSLIEVQTLLRIAKQLGYVTDSALKPIEAMLEKLSEGLLGKKK